MQVRQQQRARERLAIEILRDAPDPGARVEQERPRFAVVRERDTRRVTTDANERRFPGADVEPRTPQKSSLTRCSRGGGPD
jgi:hypothetical protein